MLGEDIGRELRLYTNRLQGSLQRISGEGHGPEEGSDAWVFLNALIDEREEDQKELQRHFEDSGRWLAEQGGSLDGRLESLQRYVDALTNELKQIFQQQAVLLVDAMTRLVHLQTMCTMALTRGYQNGVERRKEESTEAAHLLEHRLMAVQRINDSFINPMS